MSDFYDVDTWVEEIAQYRIKRFYPTIVSKDTGLPLQVVFSRLLELVQSRILFVKWEIRCTNYGCSRVMIEADKPSAFLGKSIECEFCGEEVQITVQNIFPVFGIVEGYKESVKKKKKKKSA